MDNIYEVYRIVDKRSIALQVITNIKNYIVDSLFLIFYFDFQTEYLVQWKYYLPKYSTWEHELNLQCDKLVSKFENSRSERFIGKYLNEEKMFYAITIYTIPIFAKVAVCEVQISGTR